MALIAIMPLTFATTGLGAVEIPPSEPAVTSPGQTVSKATTTGGERESGEGPDPEPVHRHRA